MGLSLNIIITLALKEASIHRWNGGPGTGPAGPLERHQAWQVREVGEQHRVEVQSAGNQELLSFGSDPFTTWYRCQVKLCLCVKVSAPHTASCGSQSDPSSQCSNGTHKWQNCTKPNDLSGTERDSGRRKRAEEPRAPFPHRLGQKSPGHWLFIKSKEKKIHLSQPYSFGHYHYKANRNKVIHKLWAVCSGLSPLPPEGGGAGPQELLL